MTFVKMIWPATKAIADIPEQAVAGHKGIGWVPLTEWTEPEAAEPATDVAAAESSAEAEPTTKTSRRRGADTQQEG